MRAAVALLALLALAAAQTFPDPVTQAKPPSAAIKQKLVEQCVTSPEEYIEAFLSRSPRCVAPWLRSRLVQASTAPDGSDDFLSATSNSLARFYGGPDPLEKYLRIGIPRSLGLYTNDPGLENAYSTPAFQGLADDSNGQALMEQIGYAAQDARDYGQVYTLLVVDSRTVSQNAFFLRPTWSNLAAYVEWYVASYLDKQISISDAVVDILRSNSFASLTKCKTSCLYTDEQFGQEGHETPVTTLERDDSGACPPDTDSLKLTFPSYFDVNPQNYSNTQYYGKWCEQTFGDAYRAFTQACNAPDPKYQFNARTNTAADLLLTKYAAATDDLTRAKLLRALLMSYCGGNFNPLFSGDGVTWTGMGGLLSPLGEEFIAPPQSLQGADYKFVSFCINGVTGSPLQPGGSCPLPA